MRAVASDREAAEMLGINVDRTIALTFFIGSAMAGVAGVMSGLAFNQISNTIGFLAGLKAFTAAVVGGIGSIPGAMIGGLFIGLCESFTASLHLDPVHRPDRVRDPDRDDADPPDRDLRSAAAAEGVTECQASASTSGSHAPGTVAIRDRAGAGSSRALDAARSAGGRAWGSRRPSAWCSGSCGPNVNIEQVAFNCMLYAMLALGLNIAVGWAGLLDLGYIAFFGFGAYGYAMFSRRARHRRPAVIHLPTIETIPIVLVGAGILGVLIGLVALRLSGDYLAIVTLFVGQAFVEIVNNVDPSTLGGVNGLFGLDPFHGFGGQITTTLGYYYVALVMVVVLAAALHLLDTSRTGRAWRALRDDPLAAEAMTIPVNTLKVMAFSFGAIVGALAGTVFAAQQSTVFPTNFTANILILIYACLVLGGVGSIAGAILGGIVVTAAEQMLSSPTDAAYLFYGLILLALLVKVRPWRYLVLLLPALVAFGFAMHAIVGAISSSAVAGSPGRAAGSVPP